MPSQECCLLTLAAPPQTLKSQILNSNLFLGTGFPRYAFPFNESDGECKYEEERFLKLPREMIYKRKR